MWRDPRSQSARRTSFNKTSINRNPIILERLRDRLHYQRIHEQLFQYAFTKKKKYIKSRLLRLSWYIKSLPISEREIQWMQFTLTCGWRGCRTFSRTTTSVVCDFDHKHSGRCSIPLSYFEEYNSDNGRLHRDTELHRGLPYLMGRSRGTVYWLHEGNFRLLTSFFSNFVIGTILSFLQSFSSTGMAYDRLCQCLLHRFRVLPVCGNRIAGYEVFACY